ncbi:citrate synthase family protein [Chloroflexi bacterium TSY]|nr:citrate synthase family protein [Chloroflexi bacterium TSY]
MKDDRLFLNADEVADMLGISKATLYSYVSRGLIRSEETEGKTRVRRYHAEDAHALREKKKRRSNPLQATEAALHFGDPVLTSAITLIHDGRLTYRGHSAIELALSHTFEEVAMLIWCNEFEQSTLFCKQSTRHNSTVVEELLHHQPFNRIDHELSSYELFQVVLPIVAAQDLAAYDLTTNGVIRTGVEILRCMTTLITGESSTAPIADQLREAWLVEHANRSDAIQAALNAALILCADHELNVSSFTARCVASAASTPYAAVIACLAALQGAKHGGSSQQVERLFLEAKGGVRRAIGNRLKRGEIIPGFGHPLYSSGDPRAICLIEIASRFAEQSEAYQTGESLIKQVGETLNLEPNLDFGLVLLMQTLQCPPGAALLLFALGRTAGWIGHIIEQYEADRMIRPRARYVGEMPIVSEE